MSSAPLQEQTVEIAASDEKMRTFVAWPDGAGKYPVVLIYMDSVGFREELRDFARRFAANGYCALLPDLYYRIGGVSFDPREPWLQSDKILPVAHALTNQQVMSDTAALLAWLPTFAGAQPGPKGCIGYCMGGRMALAAAGTFPEDFAAAVSLFGGRQVTDQPDSPHRLATKAKAEIFLGFAEIDRHVPESDQRHIDEALQAAGVQHQIERFAGAEHGFIFPQRLCYHRQAAERSWERSLALFDSRLKRRS